VDVDTILHDSTYLCTPSADTAEGVFCSTLLPTFVARSHKQQGQAKEETMQYRDLLRSLYSLLASFYPDEQSARRVAADAGLDTRHIAFSGQAINTWHAILSEAVKTAQLEALLACVQEEYGANPAFQTVYNAYVEITTAGGDLPWPLPSLDGEEAPAPGASPYKGLQYFDTADAVLFFVLYSSLVVKG
jgi:hypothetical protein